MPSSKGFGSLSALQRKRIAKKGAETIQRTKKAFKFSPSKAREAALKRHRQDKQVQARKAAMKLMELGFSAAELNDLGLSADEYIYYAENVDELRRKYQHLKAMESMY
jgi:ribosomal protein L13E